MTTPSRPHADDVVIHHPSSAAFVISVSDGRPQILCDTLEEALQRAGDFAGSRHVQVWFTNDRDALVPLGDGRGLRALWCEYVEMPALKLTRAQVRRILGLDDVACGRVLDSLVDAHLLVRGDDARYARVAGPVVPRVRPQMITMQAPARARPPRHARG